MSLHTKTPTMRTRIADDLEARGSWMVELSAGLVIGAALVVIRPVLSGDAWFAPGIGLLVAVLAVAALVRSITASSLTATLTALGAGFVGLWIVSSLDGGAGSPLDWGNALAAAGAQLLSDTPPLRETPGTRLILHSLIVVVAALVDLLALGAVLGTAALAPVLLLLAVPLVASVSGPVPPIDAVPFVVLSVALAFYLVATQMWRRKIADAALADEGFLVDGRGVAGFGGAIGLTAAAIVTGLVGVQLLPVPSGLPMFRQDGPSSLSSNRVNPIIDLGDDLRRPTPVNVFQYATTTTSGELPYFSLVTLGDLPDDASEWRPSEPDPATVITVQSGQELPRDAQLDPGAAPATMTTGLVIQRGTSAYLPIPGNPRVIDGLHGEYLLDAASGDTHEVNGDAPSQVLEVRSELPLGSPKLASGASVEVPPELATYTTLPESPELEAVQAALDGATTPGANPYERALEMQQWLANSGEFRYSLTAPVSSEYDGSNLAGIATFLEAKSGYCVHFASTMAVSARLLGIPSRIVVGFTPGERAGVNGEGQTLYQVSSKDLHAWAELYVPHMGWVPYEATPADGVGTLTATDPNAPEESPAPTVTQTVTATPTPSEVPAGSPTPDATEPGNSESATAPALAEEAAPAAVPMQVILTLVGIVLVLALLVTVPGLRRVFRIRRLRALVLGDAHDEAMTPGKAAWRAVTDRASELQLETRLERVTPALASARLQELLEEHPDAQAALERLQQLTERARFARPEERADGAGESTWADVECVRAALTEIAGPRAARRAMLMPPNAEGPRIRQRLRRSWRRMQRRLRR